MYQSNASNFLRVKLITLTEIEVPSKTKNIPLEYFNAPSSQKNPTNLETCDPNTPTNKQVIDLIAFSIESICISHVYSLQ